MSDEFIFIVNEKWIYMYKVSEVTDDRQIASATEYD